MATVLAIGRYRDQGKSFLAFVYGIAANKVSDAFRGAQVHPAYPMAEVPEAASTAAGSVPAMPSTCSCTSRASLVNSG